MNQNKGITLVALVVTIVVLIILAGVAIASIVGDEGIIRKSKQAKQDTELASVQGQIDVKASGHAIDYLQEENTDPMQRRYEKLKEDGYILTDGTVVTDKLGLKVEREYSYDKATGKVSVKESPVEEVERQVALTDEEYSYWKTDGAGTIVWYNPPSNKIPTELVVPNKIGNETITNIGDFALAGVKFFRDENGVVDMNQGFDETVQENSGMPITYSGATAKIKKITVSKGIQSIGMWGLAFCVQANEIILPSSITSAGEMPLGYNFALTKITIPKNLTSIPPNFLSGCNHLESVMIPEGVTKIGEYTFSECTALKSVTLPDSVTSMENSVFQSCSSLTEVTLPNSITTIPSMTFYGCNNLKNIYVKRGPNTVLPTTTSGATVSWVD